MKKSKIRIILVLVSFVFLLTMTSCKKKFELEFITNGGTDISSVTVKKKTNYELPTPSKEGYEFEGWYMNSEFTGEAVTSVTITNNTVVYAKWSKLGKITIDPNGGICDTSVIYGKEGETIASLLSGIIPSKNGVVFGGWFIDNVELNANMKLTTNDIVVKAKYKAEYTIEVYKQNLDLDDYELEKITEYAYIDEVVKASFDYVGFTCVDKEDSIHSIQVSETVANNVMRVYYNRDTYTITFDSNYPVEGLENSSIRNDAIYGQEVELPENDYLCKGYYLLGWSTSPDGKVIYPAHYIENFPINREEDSIFDPVKVVVKENTTLYAIWNKGYTDIFGGSDYIFLEKENKKVYLLRENIYFVGEYYNDGSFIFYNDFENLEGKLFNNGTFAYYNVSRDEYSASLYKVGSGLNENIKILFDAYNGITYSEKDENNHTKLSNGTYEIDENGFLIATFTDGDFAGKTITIVCGTVTLNNVKTDAFQIRNDEEFDFGELVRFVVYNGEITYYTSAYNMILNGFGTAIYNTGNGTATYTYTYDSESRELVLTNSKTGSLFGICRIMEVNGKKGYMVYNEDLDITIDGEDGETLVLDGLYIAEYTNKNGNMVIGHYEVTNSVFGGKIISFSNAGINYTFIVNSHTEEITLDGETTTKTVYEFVTKPSGYAEYYYKNIDGYFYAPLVVMNDFTVGYASIYGYTTSKTYELILEGSYVYDEITKLYTFTTTKVYDKEVISDIIDLRTVHSIVFALDSTSTNYAINYWYSVIVGEEEISYDVDYTSSNGLTLKLVAGLAIISNGENVITGTYTTKDGLTTITTRYGSLYLEIDEEEKTFIPLDHAPYNAYVVMGDGTYSQQEYITFDGKGNAIYIYYVKEVVGDGADAQEEFVKYTISGTVIALDEKTNQGYQIYQFTSSEKTFKFLELTLSQEVFVLPYYGEYYGTYRSNDGSLYLDGYSFYGSYTDKQGNEYAGTYSVVSDNVIRITNGESYRYFDISGRSFTARGTEYGTYIVMYNQGTTGIYVSLDGYGVLKVFKIESDLEGNTTEIVIDEVGIYSSLNGLYTLQYTEENTEVILYGYLSTYTYSSTVFNTFVIENKEAVSIYLNEKDWSILKLDSIGNATKIDKNGVEETGIYMLITDSVLYYVNDEGTNANIFNYNIEEGTIIEENFTARGYYTEDLKSLLFSQYGFAIFNNETRYYYTMNGDNVIIYHQDIENPNANAYGFVEEIFGEFDDVKVYGGETYYANDGYAITFTRKEETSGNYPVLVTTDPELYAATEELTFTPSGSDTFAVSGSVKINGQNYSCTVIREVIDGEYEMYFTIGYYRFDFNAKFTGKSESGETNSKYEVTNLTFIRSFYPYAFLDMYYMLYLFLGPNYANSFTNQLGMFYIYKTYDVDGNELEDYVKLDFFEGSNAYDLEGELLSTEKATYTYENGLYHVLLTGTDGYTYKLYFTLKYHSAFSMYAYEIQALTRVETLNDGNYQLTIERVMVSDKNYSNGALFSIELTKDGEKLEYSEAFIVDNVCYYVVRTEEDGKITSTKYYKLDLVSKKDTSLDEDSMVVQPYESVKVEELSATTYYDSEGKNYFDMVDQKITLICLNQSKYVVKSCEYSEETDMYTIILSTEVQYTIAIDENGVATITKVEVETE